MREVRPCGRKDVLFLYDFLKEYNDKTHILQVTLTRSSISVKFLISDADPTAENGLRHGRAAPRRTFLKVAIVKNLSNVLRAQLHPAGIRLARDLAHGCATAPDFHGNSPVAPDNDFNDILTFQNITIP